MSRPPDHVEKLSETLTLCEYATGGHKGFWLYDKTRGFNLSMRAKTPQDAFVEALGYYQRRLTEVEQEHETLRSRVDAFVAQFVDDEED